MHPDILPLHAAIEHQHWWFAARRMIVCDLLMTTEPPGAASRLLDLGCGTGGNLGELRRYYSCIGVEIDPNAVHFAAERYSDCEFRRGSIYDPASWHLDEPVDVCLIMDVLEHLDEDALAVSNAASVLKPGGHLLITVPADPELWSRHDRHHEHRRRYTPQSLDALLTELPVRRRLLSPFNARLYVPIRLWRWLQNHIRLLGARGTTGDLHMPPRLLNELLTRFFAAESERLVSALDAGRAPYRSGVSLIAVYQRLSP